jgi:hypothetical protein
MTRFLAFLWIATAALGFGACDGGRPARNPAAPTPPPAPVVPRHYLSGGVTDQVGSPISGTRVVVEYFKAGGESSPPSYCLFTAFCWLVTGTNGEGAYALEFEPRPWPPDPLKDVRGIGYVYSSHAGFEANFQWVPTNSTTAVQNFRLRPIRLIRAGASTVITVEPDSSLCLDLEDLWAVNHRCEVVHIEAPAGTLVVEARAPETGGVVPFVVWATTGNYKGVPTRPEPGTVSIPVGGGSYRIFVGIPDGMASQRFDVLTSLR